MNRTVRQAFVETIPVMTGYLALGFGFGIMLKASGYPVWLAMVMSMVIYAGALQYIAVGLLSGGASLLTVGLTTFLVNARHVFYGISMLDKFKTTGKRTQSIGWQLTKMNMISVIILPRWQVFCATESQTVMVLLKFVKKWNG